MPPISVLIKPSSGLCNMKCDYCFYCDETKKRARESYGFMTEQTLKNHFLVGLSVDGTKEIHDCYRHTKDGASAFAPIRSVAKIMDQCGVDYNILTVVTNYHIQVYE